MASAKQELKRLSKLVVEQHNQLAQDRDTLLSLSNKFSELGKAFIEAGQLTIDKELTVRLLVNDILKCKRVKDLNDLKESAARIQATWEEL